MMNYAKILEQIEQIKKRLFFLKQFPCKTEKISIFIFKG